MNTRTNPEAPAATPAAGAPGPNPYGLTRTELRAEVRRLSAAGWLLWELRHRFGHPRTWGAPWR